MRTIIFSLDALAGLVIIYMFALICVQNIDYNFDEIIKVEKIRLIKVCWANDIVSVYQKGKLRTASYTEIMEPTQIDKKYHLFEVIQLEEDMTIDDFEYVADMVFTRIYDAK